MLNLILQYVLCYLSAYGLGLISGLALASLYHHYKESKNGYTN